MNAKTLSVMSEPRRERAALEVSGLPDVVFGPRDLVWWGTLCFVLIEGFTLVLCAAVYIYLQQNFHEWPPVHTPRPALVAPSIHVALMLVSLLAIRRLVRAARAFDFGGTRLWLTVATLFNLTFVGFRFWELQRSLGVRWDSNAYGSAQWLLLVSHGTLLLIEAVEVGGIALFFWLAPVEENHFSDAADVAFYWWFMVLAWLPLYVLSFWLPRWL